MADPDFDARVSSPAYTKRHPKVLLDEAHFNFHTSGGRYKPFVDLISTDGYEVAANKQKFSAASLKGYEVLVIANALGASTQNAEGADQPAFTDEECDAVRDWVRAGGSLLLIADHAPFGGAAATMSNRFGVDMSKATTVDPDHYAPDGNPGFIVFTRENGLIDDHAITRGRNKTERINIVMSFTGQSLKGPAGSVALLKLAETARDRQPPPKDSERIRLDRFPDGRPVPPDTVIYVRPPGAETSAAGRAQGVALRFGKGRVVVLGEAAMLSAQIVTGRPAQAAGKDVIHMGMNHPGIDNKQLTLNILHWLSGLLK